MAEGMAPADDGANSFGNNSPSGLPFPSAKPSTKVKMLPFVSAKGENASFRGSKGENESFRGSKGDNACFCVNRREGGAHPCF